MIKKFKEYKKSNESLHGTVTVWGRNDGEEKQKLGYAGSPEAAEDLEEEFVDDFDEVWAVDETEYLKNF